MASRRIAPVPKTLVVARTFNILTPWGVTANPGDTIKFVIDLAGPRLVAGDTASVHIGVSGSATDANYDYGILTIVAQVAALDPALSWNASSQVLTFGAGSKRRLVLMPRVRENVISAGATAVATITLSAATNAAIGTAAATITASGGAAVSRFFSIDASTNAGMVGTSGSGLPTSGTGVTSLTEKTIGAVFTQTGASYLQPNWRANVQNGLGALSWDNAGNAIYQNLTTSNATLTAMLNANKQPYTLMFVGATAGINTTYAPQTAFGWYGSNGGTGVRFWEFSEGTNLGTVGFDEHDATQNYNNAGVIDPVAPAVNVFHLWTMISDGTSLILRRDGVQVATGNAGPNAAHAATYMFLGNSGDVTGWFGTIGQIDGYQAALSGSSLTTAESALATKWGTAAIPAGSGSGSRFDIAAAGYFLTHQDDFHDAATTWGDGVNNNAWRPGFSNKPGQSGTGLPNQQSEWSFNPGYLPTQPINPFSFGDNGVTLSAIAMPAGVAANIETYGASYYAPATQYLYASGHMHTLPQSGGGGDGLAVQYGFISVEFMGKVCVGAWPAALWMLPNSQDNTTEIDLHEGSGAPASVNSIYQTFHTLQSGVVGTNLVSGASVPLTDGGGTTKTVSGNGFDQSTSWNLAEFAFDKDSCTFYINRIPQWTIPTPSDYHQPFYFLVNLSMSLTPSFIPEPDASTPATLPAQLSIRNLKVYRKPRVAPASVTGTQSETTALLAAMPNAPSAGNVTLINNLISALKSYTLTEDSSKTLFSCWDRLYLISPDSKGNAGINWVAPGTGTLTLVGGGPTYTLGAGWTGDLSGNKALGTGLNLATASGLKAGLHTHSYLFGFSGVVNNPYDDNVLVDAAIGATTADSSGTNGSRWTIRNDGTTVSKNGQQYAVISDPGNTTQGLAGITRNNRTITYYKNGHVTGPGQNQNSSTDNSAFANGEFFLMSYSTLTKFAFGVGAVLHPDDWANLYTALRPYLLACGISASVLPPQTLS